MFEDESELRLKVRTEVETNEAAGPNAGLPHVLAFLRGRDVGCPVCAYNVRDLTEARCPECGERLRLRVIPAERSLALWMTMVVPALAAAGVGVLFVADVIFRHIGLGGREGAAVCGFIFEIPLAILLIWSPSGFHRLGRRGQIAAVTISLVWHAGLFVLGAITIR